MKPKVCHNFVRNCIFSSVACFENMSIVLSGLFYRLAVFIILGRGLVRLSLMGNPVTQSPYYRLYLIYHLPNLRFLDFKRIRQKERVAAKDTLSGEKGELLKLRIAAPRSVPPPPSQTGSAPSAAETPAGGPPKNLLTPEQVEKLKQAIAEAPTLEAVSRLEAALRKGELPAELQDGDSVPAAAAASDDEAMAA
eukprot:GHVT01020963.1.p1 GENE.GHVT01020963.1~~GHVT01020963.1.p1  ORF type:complete len:194 (+),score=31.39 GHVT01020963.1:2099-2680(+)